MLRLGIGKDKMTKVFKELRELGLIVEKRIGCNRCNEIYICDAEELNQVYSDAELLDLLDDEVGENKQDERVANTRNSEKQSHNKNNHINTKINENNKKQQQPKKKKL